MKAYETLLARVRKQGSDEVEKEPDDMHGHYLKDAGRYSAGVGIYYIKKGKPEFVPRPREPKVEIFHYSKRWRDHHGLVHAAGGYGLLAKPETNRDIRIERVERYETDMAQGKWITLLSDPIAVTKEGHVINGQHRLAAAWFVTSVNAWPNDPEFLVVWDIDQQEALYADGSHRTAVDEKTIAVKLVKAHSAAA